jgi:hypothetical protein
MSSSNRCAHRRVSEAKRNSHAYDDLITIEGLPVHRWRPLCYRSASAGKIRRVGYLSAGSPVTDDSPTSGPVIDAHNWLYRKQDGAVRRPPRRLPPGREVGVSGLLCRALNRHIRDRP